MTYSREEVQEKTLEYFNGNELATNVFFKYCLRNSNEDGFLELTPDDMHDRLAAEFHRIEKKYPNPRSYEEIRTALDQFKYIVPQGSPMYGVGNPKPISLSNCIVTESPEDDMSSIMEAGKRLANLFKRRCGVGVDISKLRPDGSKVNNSAETSTGAWSFADLYSYICRMVGQSGRRGALMITIDVRHPDIFKFVTMKKDLTKVTGANVSIKLRDDFMEAVEADKEYMLQWPVDAEEPKITRAIRAKELWELITETATTTAEPGLLMWDNVIRMLPAHFYKKFGFETITCNPCSELSLAADDSCRLISICLKWFVKNPFTEDAYFDYDHFEKMVRLAMRMNEDLVDLEIEKLNQIISSSSSIEEKMMFQRLVKKAEDGRRTGLGTHGLADALCRLRIKYDSDEAISVIDKIYETLKLNAYDESVTLAEERGAFPIFDWELEKDCEFFKSFPESLVERMKKIGRRNISILTNAPTGSVSIESQVDGSGIEPFFRLFLIRRRKLDHDQEDLPADFVDATGDRWIEFKVFAKSVEEWSQITSASSGQDVPDYFVTSDQIDWQGRIRVQATIQKHIDHSISSTINLPKGTSPGIVGSIYREAWKSGCKGVTVYVEGSRDGVLLSGEGDHKSTGVLEYHDAPTRPDELECDIHQTKVLGEDYTIIISLMNNKPYEVLGGKSSKVSIPPEYNRGTVIKRRNKTVPNRYDLKVNGFKISDIVSTFDNPDNAVVTRMVSMSLRHGVNPSFIVEQLSKDTSASFASFSKVLARVLKKYIEDGTAVASGKEGTCPDGTPHELVYQEGCVICPKCGWTKC